MAKLEQLQQEKARIQRLWREANRRSHEISDSYKQHGAESVAQEIAEVKAARESLLKQNQEIDKQLRELGSPPDSPNKEGDSPH